MLTLMWIDLRSNIASILLVILGLLAAITLPEGPLTVSWWIPLLGIVMGAVIACGLYTDPDTQAFIFSRGLSPRSIFAARLVLGLTIVAGICSIAAVFMWLGVRGQIHVALDYSDRVYYPISNRYEASAILRPLLESSLFTFLVLSFYCIWRGLFNPILNGSSGGRLMLIGEIVVLTVSVGCFLLMLIGFVQMSPLSQTVLLFSIASVLTLASITSAQDLESV